LFPANHFTENLVHKISVIIPTHSRPHLLSRAVKSASRAGRNVEIVVIDDASRDETACVCRELQQEYSNLRVVRLERNQGVAGARNVGLLASSGEYIAFLDDDDLRLPGSLDAQIEALKNEPAAGMACGAIIEGDGDCRPTKNIYSASQKSGDLFWEMLALNIPILPIAVVVRRECFFRIGLFNCQIPGLDDWDLWTRISELYPLIISPEPVCVYRAPLPHSMQGSSDMANHLRRAARHQKRLLGLPRALAGTRGERKEVRRRFHENVSADLIHHAMLWTKQGAHRAARANIVMALRLHPRRLLMIRPRGLAKASRLILKSVAGKRTKSAPHKSTSTAES
jgi:glycosyltransferase involved in cell wall biosynthesis